MGGGKQNFNPLLGTSLWFWGKNSMLTFRGWRKFQPPLGDFSMVPIYGFKRKKKNHLCISTPSWGLLYGSFNMVIPLIRELMEFQPPLGDFSMVHPREIEIDLPLTIPLLNFNPLLGTSLWFFFLKQHNKYILSSIRCISTPSWGLLYGSTQ